MVDGVQMWGYYGHIYYLWNGNIMGKYIIINNHHQHHQHHHQQQQQDNWVLQGETNEIMIGYSHWDENMHVRCVYACVHVHVHAHTHTHIYIYMCNYIYLTLCCYSPPGHNNKYDNWRCLKIVVIPAKWQCQHRKLCHPGPQPQLPSPRHLSNGFYHGHGGRQDARETRGLRGQRP